MIDSARSWLVLLGVSAAGALAVSQPPANEPVSDTAAAQEVADTRSDRAEIREEIAMRADLARRLSIEFEALVDRLDSGEPLDEVRRDFWQARAGWRGPGPGAFHDRAGGRDRWRAERGDEERPAPTPEQVHAFLSEHIPELAERLRELQQERPGLSERIMRRITERVSQLMAIQDREPHKFEIQLQLTRLQLEMMHTVDQWRSAYREGRADEQMLRDAVTSLLRRQHELKLRELQLEIAGLQRRLEVLETRVEVSSQDAERDIEGRVEEIVGFAKRRADEGPRDPR